MQDELIKRHKKISCWVQPLEQMTFFTLRKTAPLWWYHKSCDLRASAGTLWFSKKNELSEKISSELNLGEGRSGNTQSVYLMLCGLSLELMYKAILTIKKLAIPRKHNLKNLANSAGIQSNRQKEDLLSILTEAILWDGKYPVPTDDQLSKMTELAEIENRSLVDYAEYKGINIPRPNNKLGWDSFNELWTEANEVFWQEKESST